MVREGFFLLGLFFNLLGRSSIAVTQLPHSAVIFSVTQHRNISKHFALIKEIFFGLPRPDTLCVRCVSSSNSLTDSLAAKFILEQLFITICITSASGIKFALSISTSQAGSTNEVVASGAWIGAEVVDIPTWGDPVAAIGAWSDIEVVVIGTWTDVEAVDVKL